LLSPAPASSCALPERGRYSRLDDAARPQGRSANACALPGRGGYSRLLSRDEEIKYVLAVQAARRLRRSRGGRGRAEAPEEEDERERMGGEGRERRGRGGREEYEREERGTEGMERILAANGGMVVSLAQRYARGGVTMGDLIAAGYRGLVKGIERFDPGRGFRLSTYCYWWIRHAVMQSAMDQSCLIRLPTNLHRQHSHLRPHRAQPSTSASSSASAQSTSSKQLKFKERRKLTPASVYWPQPLEDRVGRGRGGDHDGGENMGSTIADPSIECPETRYMQQELQGALKRAVLELTDQERAVIQLRFGLPDSLLADCRPDYSLLGDCRPDDSRLRDCRPGYPLLSDCCSADCHCRGSGHGSSAGWQKGRQSIVSCAKQGGGGSGLGKRLEDVGELVGVSAGRVQQIQAVGLGKVRRSMGGWESWGNAGNFWGRVD
ncbi:hypothetical protein CLOM_g22740, partial [Closterium sp. NIES-68]